MEPSIYGKQGFDAFAVMLS